MANLRSRLSFYAGAVFLGLLISSTFFRAEAAEFKCEVLSVKGVVIAANKGTDDRSLKKGDLLSVGEEVTVGDESYVDLAYDKDWNNITRLEANTRVKIVSVAPGKLDLKNGSLFAKLKKLPVDSEFRVQTPTAVATVRGTEYLTKHIKGKTEVLNASASPIYVYGLGSDGSADKETEVVLEKAEKTGVAKAGQAPRAPAVMTPEEEEIGQTMTKAIQKNIEKAEAEGRKASIQTVEEIETHIRQVKAAAASRITAPPNESDLSRVTDTRRRAFGGQTALAPPQEESSAEPAEEQAAAPK